MKIEVKLKPFSTPNFVLQKFDHGEVPSSVREQDISYPLSAVDADSLSMLCDQFRKDVFQKAQKKDPRLT